MPITSYRDLAVSRVSMSLAEDVYLLTMHFPSTERFGLTQQLRRSAVSIPSNIAEGHARSLTRDYLRFLSIARGSLAETETQVQLANNLGFLDEQETMPLLSKADELGRMLRRLEQALQRLTAR